MSGQPILINCPACNSPVSNQAHACPRCGQPVQPQIQVKPAYQPPTSNQSRPQNAQKTQKKGMPLQLGCLIVIVVVLGALAIIGNLPDATDKKNKLSTDSKIQESASPKPTPVQEPEPEVEYETQRAGFGGVALTKVKISNPSAASRSIVTPCIVCEQMVRDWSKKLVPTYNPDGSVLYRAKGTIAPGQKHTFILLKDLIPIKAQLEGLPQVHHLRCEFFRDCAN